MNRVCFFSSPRAVVFCLFAMAAGISEVRADRVQLKDGTSIIGDFKTIQGTDYLIQTEAGLRAVPASTVERLEITPPGIKACARRLTDGWFMNTCKMRLQNLDPGRVIFVRRLESGEIEYSESKFEDLESLSFEKENEEERVIPALEKNLAMELETPDGRFFGRIETISASSLTFRTGSGLMELSESSIRGGRVILPQPPPGVPVRGPSHRTYSFLLPGMTRLEDGKTAIGTLFFSGFGVSLLTAGYQYSRMIRSTRSGESDIFSRYYMSNTVYNRYRVAKTDFQGALSMALFLFFLNLGDQVISGGSAVSPNFSGTFTFREAVSYPDRRESNFQISWALSF